MEIWRLEPLGFISGCGGAAASYQVCGGEPNGSNKTLAQKFGCPFHIILGASRWVKVFSQGSLFAPS